MYWVYVLYSDHFDKIYVGYTSDLEQRFLSHNQLATKGWSIKFRPWRIVYKEVFDTKAVAMQREKALKSAKGREYIRQQILGQ